MTRVLIIFKFVLNHLHILHFSVPETAPINVKVISGTITNTSATFQWDAPACEYRNGQILRYQCSIRTVDQTVGKHSESPSSSPTITLRSLVPFTKYYFKVAAGTSIGFGKKFSKEISFTTLEGCK